MTSALPFDDFRALIARLPDGDRAAGERLRQRFAVTPGFRELGAIVEQAVWLATSSGRAPSVRRPLVAIFAGTHGIARHLGPEAAASATTAMVDRIGAGGAAVNQVCVQFDLGLKVFDLALDLPTDDISERDAFSERDCAATMAFGMEAIAGGADLLCLGAFGAGNEMVAAAMLAALYGSATEDWLPPGRAGGPSLLEAALARNQGHVADPLEVLRRLGGREFAAVAGAIVAARMEKVPVILEGLAAMAAAAVLHALNADALSHCRLAGFGASPATRRLAERLQLAPLLELGDVDAPGVAGAMAAGIVRATAQICAGVADPRN